MATDPFQKLQDAFADSMQYPSNISCHKTVDSSLLALKDQLEQRSKKLFCPPAISPEDSRADVDVWELYREADGFDEKRVRDETTLEKRLRHPIVQHRPDPRQRLFFIHAPHSRAQLNISRKMFSQILAYHNVMPTFLEYVFPFGKQHHARDFHLMGFRSETEVGEVVKELQIPALGRHGRHIELCYSLKSVERTSDPPLGWSVRQCSIHHFLDLKSEQSTWIVIKANDVISKAIKQQVEASRNARVNSAEREPSALAASLAVHQIAATWAGENWNWYISELESHLQRASRQALAASWELPTPMNDAGIPEKTEPKPLSPLERAKTWQPFHKRELSGSTLQGDSPPQPTRANTLLGEGGMPLQEGRGFDDFSFRDLQQVQFVEEKANEALLILKSDSNVLKDLNSHYQLLLETPSCSGDLPKDFKMAAVRFGRQVDSIDKGLNLQIARVQTLLSFTSDRKSLLNAVFQYRSMQASRLYADKAQLSSQKMEDMTHQMSIIAKKTEDETVSMRIITWVTLFFLPGTFMAALFSTPIVDFNRKGTEPLTFTWSNIGVGALKLYVTASLPLILVTLLAWWIMAFRERRRGKQMAEKALNEKMNPV